MCGLLSIISWVVGGKKARFCLRSLWVVNLVVLRCISVRRVWVLGLLIVYIAFFVDVGCIYVYIVS